MPLIPARFHLLPSFATAVVAVGVVVAVKVALAPWMAPESPFLLLHAAVLFSAWRGGIGAGLLATALAAGLADLLFTSPSHRLTLLADPGTGFRLLAFVGEGTFISLLSGLRLRSSREAYRWAEELRVTLLSLGEAVVTADAGGRITFLNPAAEQMTGWAAADATGRVVAEVVPLTDEETGTELGCPVRRLIEAGARGTVCGRAVLAPRGRSERPVEYTASPLRDRDGRSFGGVVVFRDITAWRQAEAVLRRAHSDLQVAVTAKETELSRAVGVIEEEALRRQAAERARQQLVTRLTTISEDERRRISRELHDETSQTLASVSVGLKAVRRRLGPASEDGRALEELQQHVEQVGGAVHRIAWELRPAALDAMGLEAAVRSWTERWAGWAGFPVEFHSTLGPARLPSETETHLYRILTEALANVLRHARATRTTVSLERCGGTVVAHVEDNGIGFDPDAAVPGTRLGLGGMAERAALIGGVLHVESAPLRGTTVLVRVPLMDDLS
jgi:PAS domain S-box-containing protein